MSRRLPATSNSNPHRRTAPAGGSALSSAACPAAQEPATPREESSATAPARPCPPTFREWMAIARPRYYGKQILMLVGILLAGWQSPVPLTGPVLGRIVLGLVAACLIASSNYVLNEILDAATDRHHPRKRHRLLAAGRIQARQAYVLWFALGLVGLSLAAGIALRFFEVALTFHGMALAYNVPPIRLKDVPYLDVLTEALNSPLRLLLGWVLIAPQSLPSPDLLLAAWMAGAVAMTWKRLSELQDFDHPAEAAAYRRSFATCGASQLRTSIAAYATATVLLGGFAAYRLSQ